MSDLAEKVEEDLSHLYQLFCADLDMCACGNPEDGYALVRDLLALAPFYDHPAEVRDLIGGHDGAYHLVLSLLDHAGLTEHGSSIGGSWITKKGTHYLDLMRRYEYEDMDQAGYPHDGKGCPDDCPHAVASR